MKVGKLVEWALVGALTASCGRPGEEPPRTAAEPSATAAEEAGLGAMHSGAEAVAVAPLRSVEAALAGKHRAEGNRERDRFRHPAETLEFFGFKPSFTVLEYGPGRGWYTEVLAPAVAGKGKLLITSPDPQGPAGSGAAYGRRIRQLLDSSDEVYGEVETLIVDSSSPDLGLTESVDLALVIRGMHGMVNRGQLEAWLREIHAALKPGGTLGVVQHRAHAAATAAESSKLGYLPEPWVIEQVEAAGFELASKSELNANPRDSKEHAKGVWTLPPTLRLGETDKDKYLAIGESDRMTLRFTKK